jgi:16S rRNA (uracil1498-N3)-methyltransferase
VDEPAFPSDAAAIAHVFVSDLADELHVEGDDGHHLARVRRLRPGERVTAADGAGSWRPYAVVDVRAGAVGLRARGEARREPALEPGLKVAFSLTKGVKPEMVVRQLTELGVDALFPVQAEHSVPRPGAARADAMVERMRRVAREAAMQSRRARLPAVLGLCPLAELVELPDLVVAEPGPGSVVGDPSAGSWTLLVGPEGGFSDPERSMLGAASRVAVGPYVLRAETAAVAAAALLTARRRPAAPGSGADR